MNVTNWTVNEETTSRTLVLATFSTKAKAVRHQQALAACRRVVREAVLACGCTGDFVTTSYYIEEVEV